MIQCIVIFLVALIVYEGLQYVYIYIYVVIMRYF